MKSAFFLAIGALAAIPAQASDWIRVASTEPGGIVYIDLQSIRRTGTNAQAWIKYDYSRVKSSKALESKQFWKYRCADETSALVSYAEYGPDGQLIESNTTSYPTFTPVVPDSIGEPPFRIACNLDTANP